MSFLDNGVTDGGGNYWATYHQSEYLKERERQERIDNEWIECPSCGGSVLIEGADGELTECEECEGKGRVRP